MQNSFISPIPRALVQRVNTSSRLSWLLAANEYEAQRNRRFRDELEEVHMLTMRHAMSSEKAYAIFGMLLGALPSAAILTRQIGYGVVEGVERIAPAGGALLFLCVVINVVCALAGYAMGASLGRNALGLERDSFVRMLLLVPLLGAGWGGVTGLSGGFFLFFFGAFYGCFTGIVVGYFGFLMFAILHRMLQSGGMIDRRHFVPIACGISATIAAFILGL